jgi:SAM-dependent methyltransferase
VPSAADNIIDIYSRHARAWASARGKALPEQTWIDRFLKLVPNCGHVLDMGCGSGEPVAAYMSEEGFRITGVDSSPEMVAMFRANLPNQDALVEDMRNLHLDQVFDGLLAWDSFFHLDHDDQRSMFGIFREHARPNAPLMFTSGPEFGEAMGTFEGEPLYHASLSASEYRGLLGRHGFDLVAHVPEDKTCGGRTVWLARRT